VEAMSKGKTPQIRFKGYTDDWEQRKLGDCFTERVESMPHGELISVTINDGIKKFSELGRHDNSNNDKSKYKKVCVGDIAYNSMRMWQGASGYSPYEGIVSPAYTVLSPNLGINSKCLAYQFKLPEMIHTFQINSQGITSDNWNLKYPALSEIEIFVSTNEEEQAQIAEYFEALDNLITLHQRELDSYKKFKNGMLQKMFPKNGETVPEIRFPGFTDPWEQRKVGELTNVLSASRVHKEEWAEDGIPFFRSSDVVSAFKGTENEKAFISIELYEKLAKSSGKLEQNDILITGGGSIGIPYIVPDNKPLYSKDADLIWIKHSANFDSRYLYTYFISEEFREYLASISHTGTIAHYTIEQVKDTPVRLPLIDEQRALGDFFVSLDHLITLHQRKLDAVKKFKKSMLQKMFV
jgi:type I restriction enzyme S subunit